MSTPDHGLPPDLHDLFGDLFGQFFQTTDGSVRVDLTVADVDAAAGCTRAVAVRRAETCDACAGRGGATADDTRAPCATCHGVGGARQQTGMFVVQQTCPACHGRGWTIAHACATCHGGGTQPVAATLEVRVPAGTTHGSTLRLEGQGSLRPARGDAPPARGDLFVCVLIEGQPDPRPAGIVPPTAGVPTAQVHDPVGERRRLIYMVVACLACALLLGLLAR